MTGNTLTETTEKGIRGFDLDMHVAFREMLSHNKAQRALVALSSLGLHVEFYAPNPEALVPSARLNGQAPASDLLQEALSSLKEARFIEIGLRGYLRSAQGYTEWMPWRKNVVLSREEYSRVLLEKGVKYILE